MEPTIPDWSTVDKSSLKQLQSYSREVAAYYRYDPKGAIYCLKTIRHGLRPDRTDSPRPPSVEEAVINTLCSFMAAFQQEQKAQAGMEENKTPNSGVERSKA